MKSIALNVQVNQATHILFSSLVVGQEVVTPDGLGRISFLNPNKDEMKVQHYIGQHSDWYDAEKIQVIPIGKVWEIAIGT